MALDSRGNIVIVEIKVSRADLLGDGKWTDYLAHCDRFFWAVPAGFDLRPFEQEGFLPARAGIIVADRYDAAVMREAATVPLPAPTRKKCTLAFARRAARRVIADARSGRRSELLELRAPRRPCHPTCRPWAHRRAAWRSADSASRRGHSRAPTCR
jgi:hypothetical protein